MPDRFQIDVMAPTGDSGRCHTDRYTSAVGYAIDHHVGPRGEVRLLLELVDGRDWDGRSVKSASYGGGIRAVVRPITEEASDADR